MRLIILENPPIVIDHEKAIIIKTKYLNGVSMAKLQNKYGFEVKPEYDYILVYEKDKRDKD